MNGNAKVAIIVGETHAEGRRDHTPPQCPEIGVDGRRTDEDARVQDVVRIEQGFDLLKQRDRVG